MTTRAHTRPQVVALQVAARTLDRTPSAVRRRVGGKVLHEGENEFLRSRSTFVAVGRDDVVELAGPLESGTPIADYIDANHHGLFSVSLQVEGLDDATRYLKSKGIEARSGDAETFLSDPATTQAMHWAFTTAAIPNDTRPDW